MKKRNALRRVLAVLCCTAMLLPCVPAALAAETVFIDDNFDSYSGQSAMDSVWKRQGNATTGTVELSSDKAFSGKNSMLVIDDQNGKSIYGKTTMTLPVPAGTELILSAQYFCESLQGSKSPYLNLYIDANNALYGNVIGQWDKMSVIAATTKDEQDVGITIGSNSSPTCKTYWDDVKLQVLTEELAVGYINEKLLVAGTTLADALLTGLKTKALGMSGVMDKAKVNYLTAMQEARKEKGADLTKAEIQSCVDDVNISVVAESVEGGVVLVGEKGDITIDVKDLPAGATVQWVSVSPAGKSVTVSNGKATATAIPAEGEAEEVYSAVLRLATAKRSKDVNYTIRLMSKAGFDKEDTLNAAAELASNTVIGATKTGAIAAPKVKTAGVTASWDRVKTNPNNCVSVSNGQLTVNTLPTGMDYYEAVAVLKLTKGTAVTEVEYSIVVYDKTYRVLISMNNPSFEAVDEKGVPVGWVPLLTTAGSYGEGSTEVARTGNRSLHFVDGSDASNYGYRSETKTSPAKAGYEYELSFWAKGMTTSEDPTRAGIGDYLEYILSTGAKADQTEGAAIMVSPDEWTLVSQRGIAPAGTAYIRHMPYGFTSTVCDVHMDDFRTWEFTAAGSALLTDALLTGNGDATALYQRLGIKSLGVSGLKEGNKEDYLAGLTAKRAAKGSALTAQEIAAAVTEINATASTENTALIEKLIAKVPTSMTITQPGLITAPDLGDSTVTVKYTRVSGTGYSRTTVTSQGVRINSLPAYGSQDETATLVLNLSKGSTKKDVKINVTLKAYTKTVNDMATAAAKLNISDYLNGQDAGYVTSDLKALPTSLDGGISVKWQALDSGTLQPSNAVTAEGKVTRPAYGQADAAVVLRAAMSKDGEQYNHDLYIIVAAQGTEETRTMITKNVDFEGAVPADKYTNPDGWHKSVKWEDGKNMIETSYANVVADKAYTGKQALRITADGKTYDKQEKITTAVMNSAVTTASEGYIYRLDVMVYSDIDTTNPSVILRFFDNTGLEISNASASYASAPGGCGVWKNLSVSAMAPAGTVMITAELEGGTKAGATYFDDVRLREWPIVANGDFDLGTTGWTTQGKVTDGKLTLAAGQTAVSVARSANRGVTYYLSLEADGGKAALRFVDKDGKTLAEYAKDMKSGANAFFAYAPANTAGVQVVLTGAMTADNVQIIRAVTGTGVTDGDFEISATAGVGTPWDLTNATIAANTGKTGAGLTVKSDGKAVSTIIPVEDGKGYVFAVDVKGKGGKMEIQLRNFANKLANNPSVVSESNDWTTLIISYDQLMECVDKNVPEHVSAQIVLSGNAVFDNVRVYSTSKNVSNASMEDIKITPYGSFPYNWSSYGKAAAYVNNQVGQYTQGVKGLAVELFGLGEGGVRSSMLKDIKSGKAYEATINAKGSGVKLFVEFWDQDFNKLGSEFVTIDSAEFKTYSVKGTAPSGTIYASLSVGGDGVGAAVIDEGSLLPVVRSIGTNVQTFIDNWLIADSQNVERTFHEGERVAEQALVGGYPNVVWDAKEQIYKMWHRDGALLRYRTSKDGITWSQMAPCYDTATGQEVIGGAVVIDDDEPDPAKRYKGIFYQKAANGQSASYNYYTSADGVNWTYQAVAKTGYDVHTMTYDPINDEFVMTYKVHTQSPTAAQNKRTHSIAVSKDLINWTEGVRQYTVATPMDTVEQDVVRTDSYGDGMYSLGDSYVGLNWRTLLVDADSFTGRIDCNLLFSRDLTENWQRLENEDGTAVLAIPEAKPGDSDYGQIYTDSGAIRMGDETWWFYYGESGDHGRQGVPNYAGSYAAYAKWRLNGFASMDFSQGGTLTTQQFTMMGTELQLNAVGNLTVELLDAKGNLVATGKFSGDSVEGVVTWDKSIAGQVGKVVSLRFTSSDAELYTIQWCGSIFSDVSADDWYYRGVHYAVDNGIMGGYGEGKFGPNDTLSRAMVVQMLYNKVGQPKIDGKHGFNDVPADQWFNNAVTWGTKNGVMGGYGDGKFGPNDNVTIEQIAVILWNYSGNPKFDAKLGDVGSYSGWATNALTWATDMGILHGINFKNATDNATRAQAAQMLTNYLRLP